MPSSFSLTLRRVHMFLALFLSPWMAMYALSTLVFNHYPLAEKLSGGSLESYVPDHEQTYLRTFPHSATPLQIAAQLRADLQLGANLVPEDEESEDGAEDGQIRFRLDSTDFSPRRRLTLNPAAQKVIFEKQPFHFANLLTRLHARVGYGGPPTRRAWAFSVDLVIFSSVLWIFSGFWMWWELKVTRRLGLLFALIGPALFGLIWVLG